MVVRVSLSVQSIKKDAMKIIMERQNMRHVGKSKYKYVSCFRRLNEFRIYYRTELRGLTSFLYDNEREAALVIDKHLISKGKNPINILVKKKNAQPI